MPNPYGKPALEMKCPHCGSIDHHPVASTDPAVYTYPLPTKTRGGEITFRRRAKICEACGVHFQTVEMPDWDLGVMQREIERLSALCQNCDVQMGRLLESIEDLSRVAKAMRRAPEAP